MRDETELEAVRRARDSILANISHEFRTPLAAQQASIELLRDGLADMPREKLEELVDSLQRGTLRLTRLIDNLLESVRIESGPARHPAPARRARAGRGGRAGVDRRAAHAAAADVARRAARGPADPPRRRTAADAGGDEPARERQQVRAGGLRDRGRCRGARGQRAATSGSRMQGRACPTATAARSSSASTARPTRSRSRAASASGCGSSSPSSIAMAARRRRAHGCGPDAIHGDAADGRGGRMKILIVDDDADLLSLVGVRADAGGLRRRQGGRRAAALGVFDAESPDLAILDINLPPAAASTCAVRSGSGRACRS